MRQSTEITRLPAAETNAALLRSRSFLRQKLLPDLQRANARHHALSKEKGRYEALLASLTAWPTLHEKRPSLIAPLGKSIHTPVHVSPASLIAVSMGLATASETAWAVQHTLPIVADDQPSAAWDDAGLYAELTIDEARAFSRKKIAVLTKKLSLSTQRTALIQGHVELTSKSIEQLERLQQDPSASFIDLLA